jgi:translation initiation factor IF-2
MLLKLTTTVMASRITYRRELQCTVLEVKSIEGFGTTIDVLLVNGELREGDTIVVCGMNGAIVTQIRALLTPQPMKEMRVKGNFQKHRRMKGSMGVKIAAPMLDEALAGTTLLVADEDDDIEELEEQVQEEFEALVKIEKEPEGVYVVASTLGSLEALLKFLQDTEIPVFGVNIGEVFAKDVKRAAIMRERKQPQYAVILAFDVKISQEAKLEADRQQVKIMTADIIYHLFDQFTAYMNAIKEEEKQRKIKGAVFPVQLKIVPQYIFNKRDPIVVGVEVEDGQLRIGTPLCVLQPNGEPLEIGYVGSIENNKKPVEKATKRQSVALKILARNDQTHIAYGRHFDHTQQILSKISRDSIDCLKEVFRDEMSKDDWKCVVKIKKLLDIE